MVYAVRHYILLTIWRIDLNYAALFVVFNIKNEQSVFTLLSKSNEESNRASN